MFLEQPRGRKGSSMRFYATVLLTRANRICLNYLQGTSTDFEDYMSNFLHQYRASLRRICSYHELKIYPSISSVFHVSHWCKTDPDTSDLFTRSNGNDKNSMHFGYFKKRRWWGRRRGKPQQDADRNCHLISLTVQFEELDSIQRCFYSSQICTLTNYSLSRPRPFVFWQWSLYGLQHRPAERLRSGDEQLAGELRPQN